MDDNSVLIDREPDDRRKGRGSKPRQFGLRWIFVIMTVCGLLLAPYVWRFAQLRKQQNALQKLGAYQEQVTLVDGWVRRIDFGYYPAASGDVADAPNISELIIYLSGLPALEECDLTQAGLDPKGFQALGKVKTLRQLNLAATNLGDQELAHLASLVDLESLKVSQTRITDVGLQHLDSMTKLRELDLNAASPTYETTYPQITDRGISKLSSLGQLEVLKLRQSFITDAAIDDLAALQSLVELDISGTHVTPEGFERLQRALPQCEIRYENPRNHSLYPPPNSDGNGTSEENHGDGI